MVPRKPREASSKSRVSENGSAFSTAACRATTDGDASFSWRASAMEVLPQGKEDAMMDAPAIGRNPILGSESLTCPRLTETRRDAIKLGDRWFGFVAVFADHPVQILDDQPETSAAKHQADGRRKQQRHDEVSGPRDQQSGDERRQRATDIAAKILDRG